MEMRPPSTDEDVAIRLWRTLLRTKMLIGSEMRVMFGRWNLTGAQWGVIRVLGEDDPHPIALGEIGQRLLVSSGNITGIMDRLQEAGYVDRRQDQDDRRVWLAGLTPLGKEVYHDIEPSQRERIVRLFEIMTPSEQKALAESLQRIADHVQELSAEAEVDAK